VPEAGVFVEVVVVCLPKSGVHWRSFVLASMYCRVLVGVEQIWLFNVFRNVCSEDDERDRVASSSRNRLSAIAVTSHRNAACLIFGVGTAE
jgi:hypothetical protein